MKQGRSYFTVIVWILLAAIAAYFVYNVASSLYAPLMTATVTQYEAGAGYYASGFVVRAEEVVTSEYDTTVLACAEGAHVAANDVVATGYRSDDAKTRKTRMDELTGQIEQLQYAWSAASSVYDQAAIDSSIADSLSHLSQYLARRDMNSVSDLTPELIALFKENGNLTLMITVVIIVVLFSVQSRGTESIGRVFGSVVLVWFTFLAVVGAVNLSGDWSVLAALNPVYGVKFLFSPHNAAGIAVMGTVFLSTTGAEALYSDMGHVGRGNIYFTWPFIKVALVFNYFGQGAWILNHWDDTAYNHMHGLNPFFEMMTPSVRYVAVLLSVCAGVIASQALITGAYTMVSEATRLNWMPHLQVRYPARTRGQLYIPVVNAVLCVSTLLVLAMFRDSEHISAAYGLALTVTMITTTILLAVYIWHDGKRVGAVVFTVVFLAIQFLFFFASMAKFLHGGWFTMLLTLAILLIM